MRRNKKSRKIQEEIISLRQQISDLRDELSFTIRRLSCTENTIADYIVNNLPVSHRDVFDGLGEVTIKEIHAPPRYEV